MKAKDLIAELQRFDGDSHVAIQVTIRPMMGGIYTENKEPEAVEPVNDGRHSVKIIAV